MKLKEFIIKLEEFDTGKELDLSDLGNEVGLVLFDFLNENNMTLEDFISGLKHGISLRDGTH